jgi:prepilin-type N-terminal cleavage/methylation domain-containing protein
MGARGETIVERPHLSARAGARGSRGFSLLEAVVVVAVLGIIVAIGFQQVTKTLQRTALGKASNDLRLLAQRALTEMQRRSVVTFVRIGPAPGSTLRVKLIADTNGPTGVPDGALQDPTDGGGGPFDTLVDSFDITLGAGQQIALSSVAPNQVEADRWLFDSDGTPAWADYATTTDIARDRVLMCDLHGRTVRPDTGLQIDRAAGLRFTHVNILAGTLQPPVRYELHISPVWSVQVVRQVKNSANVWVATAGEI